MDWHAFSVVWGESARWANSVLGEMMRLDDVDLGRTIVNWTILIIGLCSYYLWHMGGYVSMARGFLLACGLVG